MNLSPTKEQAEQLALMLAAGMPSADAIRYFLPEDAVLSEQEITALHVRWMKARTLQDAVLKLQGKPWQHMEVSDRIRLSIEKHYSEMAWFLYANNYNDLDGPKKAKADTCRQALEAKLAGMAGKLNALEQFYQDVASGKVAISRVTTPGPKLAVS